MEKPITFEDMVQKLAKPGSAIHRELIPADVHLWHMATGIAGEAGELLDGIKKPVVYRKPLDRANIVEELGDLEFYMEGLRAALGITREETIEANMNKLLKGRYRDGYSDQAAQARADKPAGE